MGRATTVVIVVLSVAGSGRPVVAFVVVEEVAGTGTITTVVAPVAVTVVEADVFPTMIIEGRGVVVGSDMKIVAVEVPMTVVVDVIETVVVDCGLEAATTVCVTCWVL